MNTATQVRNLIALRKFNDAILYAAEHMVIAPPHDEKVKDCAHMIRIGKSNPTQIANARRILVMITAPIKLNLTGPKIPKGSPIRLIDKGYRLKKIKNKFDSMGNPWIYRVENTAGTVFYLRRVIVNTDAPHLTQHGEMREENRVYYSKMIEINGEIYMVQP